MTATQADFSAEYKSVQKAFEPVVSPLTKTAKHIAGLTSTLSKKSAAQIFANDSFKDDCDRQADAVSKQTLSTYRYMHSDVGGDIKELSEVLRKFSEVLKERTKDVVYGGRGRLLKTNVVQGYIRAAFDMDEMADMLAKMEKSRLRLEVQCGKILDAAEMMRMLLLAGVSEEEAKEEIRQIEADRAAERERKKREEEERRRLQEERRKEEEERRRKKEEERLKREEDERKRREEQERKQQEEEAKRRKEEEEKARKEEEERINRKEAERKRQEEEELKRREEEERRRTAEEERQRKLEAKRLKEEEERMRMEEEERVKRAAEEKKREEDRLRKEEEQRRKEEEERKKLEAEELKRKQAEEKKLKEEEEKQRIADEEKRRKQEADRLKKEDEERKKEEARKRKEEERLKKELEAKKKQEEEEEKKHKEEEERKRKEEEKRLKEEEERKRKEEEERKKHEEELKRKEEERKRKEEEEKKRKTEEEERKRKEEEERRKKEEEERLKKEVEEKRKKEEEERQRKEKEALLLIWQQREAAAKEEKLRKKREAKERERVERERKEELKRQREAQEEAERQSRWRRAEEEAERERLRLLELQEQEKRRQQELEEIERLRREKEEEEERIRQEQEEERFRKEEEERQKREKEEERKRIEEEKRQAREEEERRIEEERLAKVEEERKKREDPNYFPVIVYYIDENQRERDLVRSGVACVVRAPEIVGFSKQHLDVLCRAVTEGEAGVNREGSYYQLERGEQRVSNVITIKSATDRTLSFEYPVWLALPYTGSLRGKELCIKHNYPADNITPEQWTEASVTRDAIIQTLPAVRLAELPLQTIPDSEFNFLVLARSRLERFNVGKQKFKLSCDEDPRVSLSGDKDSFNKDTSISIQINNIDASTISSMKLVIDIDGLVSCSPLVNIRMELQPSRALSYTIPNPSGVGRENPPQLIIRGKSGRWRQRSDIELTVNNSVTSFKTSEKIESSLLVKTSETTPSERISELVERLETGLHEIPSVLVVCQSTQDPANIYVECSPKDSVNKTVEKLKQEQDCDVKVVNALFLLREDDLIAINFHGNLSFTDNQPRLVTFNSQLHTAKFSARIQPNDTFAQKSLNEYRGYMTASLVNREHNPSFKGEKVKSSNPALRDDRKLLCEVLVRLPKGMHAFRIQKDILQITTDVLTEEYLSKLSQDLGNSSSALMRHLGVSEAAVARVRTQLEGGVDTATYTKGLLLDWLKSTGRADDKVDHLISAMTHAGREDLAGQLRDLNESFLEDQRSRKRGEFLDNITRIYSSDSASVRAWQATARALHLTQAEVASIKTEGDVIGQESVREMFTIWQRKQGDLATKENLVALMKKLKLLESAGRISQLR